MAAPNADDPDDRPVGALPALNVESPAVILMVGEKGRETPSGGFLYSRVSHPVNLLGPIAYATLMEVRSCAGSAATMNRSFGRITGSGSTMLLTVSVRMSRSNRTERRFR